MVSFDEQNQIEPFCGDTISTFSFQRLGHRTMVVSGSGLREEREIKFNLAHDFIQRFSPQNPPWLREGLANFLSWVHIDEEGQAVELGRLSEKADVVQKLNLHSRAYPTDLFAAKMSDFGVANNRDQLESGALVLVLYLFNVRPKEFVDFQVRLGRGQPWRDAWNEVLPDLPLGKPDAIDDAENKFLAERRMGGRRIPFPTQPAPEVKSRALSEAEVHGLRAQIYMGANTVRTPDAQHALAKGEVDQALAKDANQLRALSVLVQLKDPSVTPDRLRAATVAHPDEPLGWQLLGEHLQGDADRDEKCNAWLQATKLEARDGEAQRHLARCQLAAGKLQDALATATHAASLVPWDVSGLETLAETQQALGMSCDAVKTETRARTLLVGPNQDALALAVDQHLAKFAQGCSGTPATPASAPPSAPATTPTKSSAP